MLRENKVERDQMEFFCIDSFVPQDHLLRKIEYAVDFSKLFEIIEDLYCPNNGRPSIDPVVLFNIVFIQHLYGIPSLRRTCEEIKMNVAYRRFLGYLMSEQLPHFSTVSYNFKQYYYNTFGDYILYFCIYLLIFQDLQLFFDVRSLSNIYVNIHKAGHLCSLFFDI